jgi:chemotaxis protein CheZ
MTHAYGRDEVVHIINSVIGKIEQVEEGARDLIYQELHELKQIIDDARKAMGASRPADIGNKHIPAATDELDAVIKATAEASGTIMDSCEIITHTAGVAGGETEAVIGTEVTKIYEACSFQDITGQRITKVLGMLKDIDSKVEKLMAAIGGEKLSASDEEEVLQGDAALLSGPQMPEHAISQDEIDRLLAEFDE